MSKAESLTRVAVAYVLAFGAATAWLVWGPDTDHLWLDGLIADVIATLVVFAVEPVAPQLQLLRRLLERAAAVPRRLLGVASEGAGDDVRTILVLAVILLWAVRLTVNWVIGFPGLHHEDWRYPLVRERAGRLELVADFFGIHLIPTFQVFLGLVPAYVAVARPGRDLGWLDAVATVVGIGAVLLQLVADGQMRRFIRDRREGEAMDRGLWGWSRHPNYFGEISFWCSLGLFGIAASPGDWWWLMVGGVAMLAMFLGASIPMMEGRSLERRPSYQDVIDRVPMLVPRPPRRRVPS